MLDVDVGDGGRWKTTRTTCTEVDWRRSDVLWSRHQSSSDDDWGQRQLEKIRVYRLAPTVPVTQCDFRFDLYFSFSFSFSFANYFLVLVWF